MPEISPTTWYGAITLIILGIIRIYLDVKAGNKKTERVLIMSNGRMTVALKNIARLSRALALQTNDPEDLAAAKLAEDELSKKIDDNGALEVRKN